MKSRRERRSSSTEAPEALEFERLLVHLSSKNFWKIEYYFIFLNISVSKYFRIICRVDNNNFSPYIFKFSISF